MEIILLEKVRNLGKLGDKVKVSPGYARNYLIPGGHALPATGKNLQSFEVRRSELEQKASDQFTQAEARATTLKDANVTIEANMSDEGKLFGSIGTRDIVDAMNKAGHKIQKKEVLLPEGPIHQAGVYDIGLMLHTDVRIDIKINIVPANKSHN